MASAMGRPDLAQMMLTGQYGPLAGQNYQYGGGQTRINYGGAGAGAGAGLGGAGAGGTGGRLGPLGGAGADTAAAAVVNPDVARQDWWPPGASNARMAAWMRDNPGKTALDWTNQLPKLGESLAGLRGLFGGGGRETATPEIAGYGESIGVMPAYDDVRALAARTPVERRAPVSTVFGSDPTGIRPNPRMMYPAVGSDPTGIRPNPNMMYPAVGSDPTGIRPNPNMMYPAVGSDPTGIAPNPNMMHIAGIDPTGLGYRPPVSTAFGSDPTGIIPTFIPPAFGPR